MSNSAFSPTHDPPLSCPQLLYGKRTIMFLRCLFCSNVISILESLPCCVNYVIILVLIICLLLFFFLFKDTMHLPGHRVHILEFLILFVFQRPVAFQKKRYIDDRFSEALFCIFLLLLHIYALANYKISLSESFPQQL